MSTAQEFQNIANFLLSDSVTIRGDQYLAMTLMLKTIRDAVEEAKADAPPVPTKEGEDAGDGTVTEITGKPKV